MEDRSYILNVTNLSNPTGEAEAGAPPMPSPATGADSPGVSQPVPATSPPKKESSRSMWKSGDPDYPFKSTNRDEKHWNELYEKVVRFDKEFCEGWNSEIDALLTFAGLFSAVVTAFTIESYKLLQPDPQDVTNYILLSLTAQVAGRNVTTPPPGSFTPSASSIRINALWFLSLTFSLTAGLVGILCKQWLRYYQQDISKPPKEALAMRQFRHNGFTQCGVMSVLSTLPILLGLGLILFFVGLIDFLQDLDVKVSIPVIILIGVGFAFLAVTTSVPAFQYFFALEKSKRFDPDRSIDPNRPALFAFKSPQSLAVLHLATWLFPLERSRNLTDWVSLEVKFFSDPSVLKAYTKHALIWLDETYSHSMDVVRQICLCLQDSVEDMIIAEGTDEWQDLWKFSTRHPDSRIGHTPGGAAIELLFSAATQANNRVVARKDHTITQAKSHAKTQEKNHVVIQMTSRVVAQVKNHITTPGKNRAVTPARNHTQVQNHVKRDIIAMGYLSTLGDIWRSNDLHFRALQHLTRILNSSHYEIPSLAHSFNRLQNNDLLLATQMQELIWQRANLFRNLLSEGRWSDRDEIPKEVQNVSENLEIFDDKELDSIFDAICTWISNPNQDLGAEDKVLPSRCWAVMASRLKSHELDDRPPARNFMNFLDLRFQMDEGVEYICEAYDEEVAKSFFTALYAWIEDLSPTKLESIAKFRKSLEPSSGGNENFPTKIQLLANCRASLEQKNDNHKWDSYQSFRDFMAFLEVQEQIWQRAHLFQDVLVSWKGKLEFGDSSEIPRQVQNVSKNLKTFSEKDLGENFDLLRKWMDDHHDLQDVGMPSRCWAALTSQLKPSEIQHHPPVRDFMAFLDPKFQIDEGVRFLCSEQWYRDNEKADSFFEALDAWIKKNKPDVQSFTRCQTMLETLDPSRLERMRRWYKPFRVFEASLEVRIAGGDDVTEQDPVRDPEYISSSSGSTNKHQWARSSVSLREMRSGHAESTEDGNGMKEET